MHRRPLLHLNAEAEPKGRRPPLMTGPTLADGRTALDIRPTWLH